MESRSGDQRQHERPQSEHPHQRVARPEAIDDEAAGNAADDSRANGNDEEEARLLQREPEYLGEIEHDEEADRVGGLGIESATDQEADQVRVVAGTTRRRQNVS